MTELVLENIMKIWVRRGWTRLPNTPGATPKVLTIYAVNLQQRPNMCFPRGLEYDLLAAFITDNFSGASLIREVAITIRPVIMNHRENCCAVTAPTRTKVHFICLRIHLKMVARCHAAHQWSARPINGRHGLLIVGTAY